ncbi:MAG: Smr/MutS family protein, partial [Lacunisphaera sp.]
YRPLIFFPKNQAMPAEENDEPVAIPITGELDLHTFQPKEVSRLLDDYFAECQKRGIHRVRVIHGKGTGALRETVHANLRGNCNVTGYAIFDANLGGWGATWVTLGKLDPPS